MLSQHTYVTHTTSLSCIYPAHVHIYFSSANTICLHHLPWCTSISIIPTTKIPVW